MHERLAQIHFIEPEYNPIEEAQSVLQESTETIYKTASEIESQFSVEEKQYLLKGTGFETAKQAETLFKIKLENPSLTNKEINEIFATRTSMDFLGYYWEFLARNPFLVNFVEYTEEEIRSSKTGQRLLTVINSDERSGAAKAAIEHLEESFKKGNQENKKTLYAIHSPRGWAQDGLDEYPEDQIYLYAFDEQGKLSAGTMRLTMDLEEHEKFLGKLIGDKNYNKGLDYKNKLISVSSTIVQLEGENFEKYLSRLEKQCQRKTAWEDRDKKGKLIKKHSFKDLRQAVQNRDQLINIDEDIENIATDLDLYLRQNIDFTDPENLKSFVIKMGSSAMDMQYTLKVKKGYRGKKDYQKLASEARDLGGCVASSTEARLSPQELLDKGYKSEGRCNKCSQSASSSDHMTWVGPCSICYKCVIKYWGKIES